MTPHAIAWINLVGILLIIVGTLFWAYELLGGREGPLALLTRAVSYGLIYSIAYSVLIDPIFGIVAGTGLGSILALEFHRVSRYQRLYQSTPLHHAPRFGFARGLVFGLASLGRFGWKFGACFGGMAAVALYVVYRFRFSPTFDYKVHSRPVITRHRVYASLWRSCAVGGSAALAGILCPAAHVPNWFPLIIGIYVGIFSGVISTLSPVVEWHIDNQPGNRVAAIGVGQVLIGSAILALPSLWAVLH